MTRRAARAGLRYPRSTRSEAGDVEPPVSRADERLDKKSFDDANLIFVSSMLLMLAVRRHHLPFLLEAAELFN